MNTEEKDGTQPRQRKRIVGGQSENTNPQERRPAYHAGRDGSGYQVEGHRPAAGSGKRPRIKDSQRVNYNQQGNDRGNYQQSNDRGNYHQGNNDRGNYHQGNNDRGNYQQRYSQSDQGDRRGGYSSRPSQQYGQRSYNSQDGGSGYGNSGYGNRDNNRSSYSRRPSQDGNYRGGQQSGDYRGGGGRPSYGNRGGGGGRNSNYNNSNYGNRQQPRGNYNPNAKYSHQKQLKYKEALTDPNEPIRLNKFLANAGVCSRREADEFIQAGVVRVNDQVITELGTKITRQDKVTFHEQPVQIEAKLYILLNKPKNCVTTSDDPQGRLTVMELVKNACEERIYPVGRLDRNTTGVLLLTNDGDLASKLTHPSFKKKKIYHVWLDKDVSIEDMEKLANGIELEDGEIHADAISYANEEDRKQVGIEIHSGRNRIVRRMFESLGYHVTKLDRVYFAGLTKKNLPRSKWRYLNEREVNMLRMGAFE